MSTETKDKSSAIAIEPASAFGDSQPAAEQLQIMYGAKKEALVFAAIDILLYLVKEKSVKDVMENEWNFEAVATRYEELADYLLQATQSCAERAKAWRNEATARRDKRLQDIMSLISPRLSADGSTLGGRG